MLIIREEQMEALNAYMLQSFKTRIARHVTEVLPAQVQALGPEGLAAAIDQHLAAAKGWGLTSERDVARYIDLRVGLGPEAKADAPESWVGKILGDPAVPPPERLNRIYAEVPKHAPACAHLPVWWTSAA